MLQAGRAICQTLHASLARAGGFRSNQATAIGAPLGAGSFHCDLQGDASSWHQRLQAAFYSRSAKETKTKKGKKAQIGDSSAHVVADDDGGGGTTLFEEQELQTDRDAVRIVLRAIDNVTPQLDVRTLKQATKTLYVPGLMPPRKARSVAIHWLVQAAEQRKRNNKATFAQCLALELLMAYQKQGVARKKRDDLHKLALQSRANVGSRWW